MAKSFDTLNTKPTHDEIAKRAYAIFEKSGRVPGRDLQNWLEAETHLRTAERAPQQAASASGIQGKSSAPAPMGNRR